MGVYNRSIIEMSIEGIDYARLLFDELKDSGLDYYRSNNNIVLFAYKPYAYDIQRSKREFSEIEEAIAYVKGWKDCCKDKD